MAVRIVRNTRHKVLLHATGSESALTLVGNGSVSDVGDLNITDDTIIGCTIRNVTSSADSRAAANGWTILRGANTVWFSDSTSQMDFSGFGADLSLDPAATITLTRTGGNGTILVELQKTYAITDSDY